MTSSPHGPYAQGYKHATMASTEGCQPVTVSESQKAGLSSDCRLKFACMKPELLVIVGQPYYGEYVPGPCTHRPSRHGSRQHLKSLSQPSGGRRSRWGW